MICTTKACLGLYLANESLASLYHFWATITWKASNFEYVAEASPVFKELNFNFTKMLE